MLLGLLLELIGELAFGTALCGAGAAYAIDDFVTKDKIIMTKTYSNQDIEWLWGDNPNELNFQDFIGLSVEELKAFIPDVKEKKEKAWRKLDYYEMNWLFNDQGLCVSVEYLRPKDPKWPYATNGVFPLENSYTESEFLKIKSTKKYPVYIYRRTSIQTDNADIFYAEIRMPEE
ncbi:MAG: hypothetical protein IK015_08835 [Treponema sp.]|nr:hypothetical protein [Treponema sp.]